MSGHRSVVGNFNNEHSLFLRKMDIDIILDGLFAAVAAIGFGSISNVPIKAFVGCALLAALGHATRFFLMHSMGWNIIPADLIGAIIIGVCAPLAGRFWNAPAESLAYPALLPMIPGMYAYRAVEGLLMCLTSDTNEDVFDHALYLFTSNSMTCTVIVVLMVLGVTIPFQIANRHVE